MMAFDMFAEYPRCADVPDSSLFLTICNDSIFISLCTYIRIQIHEHLSKRIVKTLCLMLCMEFCLSDLTVMKANVVANQWPWSLRDVFADAAARVQSLVTAHHHHKATRKDSPILAEPQQSINNVKAWAVLQIKVSLADDFRARPIVNEEGGGFVAEKTNVLLYCCCFFGRETQTIVKQRWNLLTLCMRALFLEHNKITLFLHSCDWGFKPSVPRKSVEISIVQA